MPTDDVSDESDESPSSVEIRTPPAPFFLVETYVANPIVTALLRSNFHWPLSKRLMLISYVGRRSGERHTTPVGYERRTDTLIATTLRDESNWWKNFREEYPVTVWLRGYRRQTTGLAVTDSREIAEFVRSIVERYGGGRLRIPGLKISGDDLPTVDEFEAVADDLVVVRFTLEDEDSVFEHLHLYESERRTPFGSDTTS